MLKLETQSMRNIKLICDITEIKDKNPTIILNACAEQLEVSDV